MHPSDGSLSLAKLLDATIQRLHNRLLLIAQFRRVKLLAGVIPELVFRERLRQIVLGLLAIGRQQNFADAAQVIRGRFLVGNPVQARRSIEATPIDIGMRYCTASVLVSSGRKLSFQVKTDE